MNPNDQSDNPTPQSTSATQQTAATQIVRGQIDSLYGAEQEQTDAYHRTHTDHVQPTAEQWKQYHSAWQDYYQKYYERYYAGHLYQAKQAIASQLTSQTTPPEETLDEEEALYELRSKLLGSVQEKAKQVRKSRHFVPLVSAALVMLLFAFLQYNQLIMANLYAYMSPGAINPQNIIVDPTLSTNVDPKSTNLIIPKINVDVPVNYSAKSDYNSQMAAMRNGLAYFGVPGANSKPGQLGNTPIAGHSSSDVFWEGDYKFIFAQLEQLKKGDVIYANYQGTRYTYTVTKVQTVKPNDVKALVMGSDKPLITLITCTPVGTAQNRLLVTAEQISPAPKGASAASPSDGSTDTVEIPGTQPSVLQRLFGSR